MSSSSSPSSSAAAAAAAAAAAPAALLAAVDRRLAGVAPWKLIALACGATLALRELAVALDDWPATKQRLGRLLVRSIEAVPLANAALAAERAKTVRSVAESLDLKEADAKRFLTIPAHGRSNDEILAQLEAYARAETPRWRDGHVSGGVYGSSESCNQLMERVFGLYLLTNPLHFDLFPSVVKMEQEVVSMTLNLLHASASCVGVMTSGGTESIFTAMLAYRNYARNVRGIRRPEFIACVTAHAAFQKACHYLDVKLTLVPTGADFRVDVAAVKRAINANTAVIIGSAPEFAHGIIDDIPALAAIARERGIGLHVDACLGGFILPFLARVGAAIPPFDFAVEGVTSMSCDTHKYAFASKGSSVVMFRNKELRHAHYFTANNWPGGIYFTPTLPGSRPGALIATTWAAIVSFGVDGYEACARDLWRTVQALLSGLRAMPEMETVGDPKAMVIAMRPKASSGISLYGIVDVLSKRGWALNVLQLPECVHLCVTMRHVGREAEFLGDVADAIKEVRAHPENFLKGAAAVYGLAASVPAAVVEGLADDFLDCLLARPQLSGRTADEPRKAQH